MNLGLLGLCVLLCSLGLSFIIFALGLMFFMFRHAEWFLPYGNANTTSDDNQDNKNVDPFENLESNSEE